MAPPRKPLPPNGKDIIARGTAGAVGEVMLAESLGMSYSTWARRKRDDPEIRAIWLEAQARLKDHLVGLALQAAEGSPAEFDNAGNCIRAERAPYPPATFFLLKGLCGVRETGPVEGEASSAAPVLLMPVQMTMDQVRGMFPTLPLMKEINHAGPSRQD